MDNFCFGGDKPQSESRSKRTSLKKLVIVMVLLFSFGLFGCAGKSAGTVTGHVELLPGQDTPAGSIRISVFRFDSGEESQLYPVDDRLNFSFPLQADGEYSIEAVVEGDEGFSTQPVRLVMKDAKIANNKRLELRFILTQID